MVVKSTRYALVFMILAVILFTAVLDLLPPIEKDTLIYHLAVPKIWLNAGGVIEIPWLENSYFPMNLNLLYMAPLSFDFDIGAKFIHNFFGLLTALLIFLYLKKRISTNWALLGGLIFLSTPLIVRLSASAYVDLGLAFFTTAATLGIIYWQDTGKWIYFILSSIALGLALGTKYNSVFALAFLSCGVLWFYKRSGNGWVKSGGVTFIYAGLALLLFAPWAVKNYIFTGNPTYPLYNQLWGVATYFPERYSVSTHMLREHMFGEPYWQTLLIPIRFFFEGRDFSMEYFDGVLNPFLLLLPPLALVRPGFREIRPLALFAGAWMLLVVSTTPYMMVRYITPTLPLLTILAIFGLHRVWEWIREKKRNLAVPVLACILVTLFSLNGAAIFKFWQALDPWPFLTGQETRSAYLNRTEASYPAIDYMNRHLDPRAKILLLMAGDRGYYLDREYIHCSLFSNMVLEGILKKAESWEDILTGMKALGLTHVMTNDRLLVKYLQNYDRKTLGLWRAFTEKGWTRRYHDRGFSVYELG